ncbi:MAG: sugar-binding protein [Victivallaceae bacterium]|nr:sugar-binding protein [Victivallaceae bacterium]
MNRVFPAIILFFWALVNSAAPPRLDVGRMPVPPTLDGIEPQEWSKAAKITDFHLFGSQRPGAVSPLYPTTAWAGCDRDNLYIAVRCDKGNCRNLKASERKRDGKIYHDDSVEVFLNTTPEENNYYHFIVNALGTLYDGFVYGSSAKISNWSSNRWQAAARQEKDFWAVEIKIPFCILRFGKNPVIRFNIARNNYHPQEAISWCPIKSISGWHQPEQFGCLDKLDIADYQSLTIKQIDFSKLVIGKNTLTMTVDNNRDRDAELKVELGFRDGSETVTLNSIISKVPARQQKHLTVPFEIKTPGKYTSCLTVCSLPDVCPLYVREAAGYEVTAGELSIAPAFYDTAVVTGNIHLFVNPIPPHCKLQISLQKNQASFKTYTFNVVATKTLFSLGKLPPGYYQARLEVVDGKKQQLWSEKVCFWVVEYFLTFKE